MFTGIIQAVGNIVAVEQRGVDARVRVESKGMDFSDVKLGDSISVSGVCLTIVELSSHGFAADISAETLSCTTVGDLKSGTAVNLEKALLPTTRLGGHLVSGHVDGVGIVRAHDEDGRSIRLRIEAPTELARYVATKGSICVDGVSLTVNSVDGAMFDLNIIPHTMAQTTLGEFQPGRRVNLEVDVLARYLERLLQGEGMADAKPEITRALLTRHGFLK